jgi:hypothetical protein
MSARLRAALLTMDWTEHPGLSAQGRVCGTRTAIWLVIRGFLRSDVELAEVPETPARD